MSIDGKNILIIMPNNQFDGDELLGLLEALEPTGARVVVLSKSGREATGMKKERFTPDGTIIDWNKQEGVSGKYHAIVLTGGKGAAKSLWNDPIVPQILVDHHRAGSIIAAIGTSIVVVGKAGLLPGRAACPGDSAARSELENQGIPCEEVPVLADDRIVTANGCSSIQPLVENLVYIM
ncbi:MULTISPECIES: DJ-1/PfpI family protein [unclassified Nitrospina]|uniref:DJ-1/PfpI family protein n=1 Tax=unclassified Nitrospina TaxID=2638683 RepID=UPI003F9634F2